MPDLPLDTLIILGLVFASLIGRIFKKKEAAPSAKPSSRKAARRSSQGKAPAVPSPVEHNLKTSESAPGNHSSSLEDILKKAFSPIEESVHYEPIKYEEKVVAAPPPIPPDIPEFSEPRTGGSPDPIKSSFYDEGFSESSKFAGNANRSLRDKLFTEKKSLREAILLKEILDKPVSLRSGQSE